MSTQTRIQNADIETGIVSNDAVIAQCVFDFLPVVAKVGLVLNVFRIDSVNPNVAGCKEKRFRPNHPHRAVYNFAFANANRRKLTGAVLALIGRFKVDRSKVGFELRHPSTLRLLAIGRLT